ncbi:hypothetical protein RUM44_005670 [Polyplax serrata]|uniref:Transmembrane protein 209 n=1 Tax=Polyplax serrata TaxID=468196 RepID=A0ABR1AW82_POLSC
MDAFPRTPVSHSPARRNPTLDNTLNIQQTLQKARGHLFWGCINVVVLSVFLYDLLKKFSQNKKNGYIPYQVEILLTAIFGINTFFHFVKYIFQTNNLEPVTLSPTQKKLLGIKSHDPYFKTVRLDSCETADNSIIKSDSEYNKNSTNTPRLLFPSLLNESVSPGHNYAVPSQSWMYQKKVPSPNVLKPALHPVSAAEDFITGEQSLGKYIQEYEEHEKKACVSMSTEETPNSLSFWNTSNSRSINEVSPLLRRCTYQLSTLAPVQVPNNQGTSAEESGSPSAIQQNQELWRHFKVDPLKLVQWNANLRMWISQTVLQRLVKEFDKVDDAFQKCGLSDMRLGLVGLERLKKTAGIPQIASSIPSLPRLVLFLEITPHQEYLVARIRELAKGGSISEYRWDGGGTLNGKNWEEHLPTDAAVVMHLIATYLDSQILFLPQHSDGRPFTTNHFIRSPEKPKVQNALVIYQVQLNPPHFVLLENNDRLEVAKGRNNLFHTFLLFLHILKTKEHGMLGRVNLGSSGVNILWVVDD